MKNFSLVLMFLSLIVLFAACTVSHERCSGKMSVSSEIKPIDVNVLSSQDLASLIEGKKFSFDQVVKALDLKRYKFSQVEGAALNRPVRRYRLKDRLLFFELIKVKDGEYRIERSYFVNY